jgi:hypothetical protein
MIRVFNDVSLVLNTAQKQMLFSISFGAALCPGTQELYVGISSCKIPGVFSPKSLRQVLCPSIM